MNGWQETKFGELVDVVNGFAFKSANFLENMEDGSLPVLKIKNVANGNVHLHGIQYHEYSQNLLRYVAKQGDVLIALTGNHPQAETQVVGLVSRYKLDRVALINQRVAKIVSKNEETLSIDYVYYFLKDTNTHLYLASQSSGSANQANISKSDIENIPFLLPPQKEQKAIATVLSSLDDKIDLLHRQNKTLEAMAETLFRQWFVEEAGNWEEVALEDITNRITDGAHASPPTVETGLPMASVKDMYQWGINTASCRQISQDDFDELVRTDCRPLKNDILIAKDGSYLKHVFVAEDDLDVVILSSIAILRPNGKYHPLLLAIFLKLESTRESLENIVTGAVIPRIVLKDFRKYKLLLPPKQLQDQALAFIQPIYEKCWENDRQIRTLETLRDTLLPKLMSGEVRVAV
ncbi:MAG: restriction endonuclease subunit S [Deltaproteobacteria bacterium]|nr:restriction endonuclease subunit S [Deltaproteobacteria bacterium]